MLVVSEMCPYYAENFLIMMASCFMLSSPYYAINYAGIIDRDLTGDLLFRMKFQGLYGLYRTSKMFIPINPKLKFDNSRS